MIRVENVTKKFGQNYALDGLTMTVPKGSVYGLMGVNGAGKTTIIRHLAGFLIQDNGSITVEGETVADNEKLKERMVFIPDEVYFFRGYSLKEMSEYYRNIYPGWDQTRFDSMVRDFGLDLNQNLGKFSRGMRKQAAFCLAMSAKPDYLILDEPVDGLDPIVRHKLKRYIFEDVADREMTVLISSHNAKEMEDMCNYIGLMKKGRMVFEGDLMELDDVTVESLFLEKLGDIHEGGEIDG
ncbi:MAG: ABC transporter ATP-binding protein [Firmicutes bacterium]|nr:ABC transporter ATP-binding protein [Bacillota bacterium]